MVPAGNKAKHLSSVNHTTKKIINSSIHQLVKWFKQWRVQICYKKWYAIDSQPTKGKYKQGDTIEFETESIKSSLCDYSDAFILVTGNITVTSSNDTNVAYKNCAPFSTCKTVINDVHVEEVNHIYIAMPMYSLIEYTDNYSDASGSLWQFKRDEVPANNADLTVHNSQSFRKNSKSK